MKINFASRSWKLGLLVHGKISGQITASSQLGVDGTVKVFTSNVDPAAG
ncbi:MAG: hypothetical protein GDA56_29680 [Hormoscilla sp. GM7CHS1pb]|nr:hypothetical protein [Hormoscilla sp. GM7CHS1pb]